MTPGRSVMIAALLKFIGVVGQSDIFYECPTKNITVLDQISNRKYKNIHLVYEKKQNTSDHKGQLGLCQLAVFVGTRSTLNFRIVGDTFFL